MYWWLHWWTITISCMFALHVPIWFIQKKFTYIIISMVCVNKECTYTSYYLFEWLLHIEKKIINEWGSILFIFIVNLILNGLRQNKNVNIKIIIISKLNMFCLVSMDRVHLCLIYMYIDWTIWYWTLNNIIKNIYEWKYFVNYDMVVRFSDKSYTENN